MLSLYAKVMISSCVRVVLSLWIGLRICCSCGLRFAVVGAYMYAVLYV